MQKFQIALFQPLCAAWFYERFPSQCGGGVCQFLHCGKVQDSCDQHALIRGALLHDYFLYDWHEKDDSHKWHGFYHAGKALQNAMEDFALSEIEKETIRRHMFPLNPIPPRCREAWIVTLADKICSGGETVEGLWEKFEEIRNPS